MSEFTNWKSESGQWRFCPYCEADLWIRSCGHFPMGDEGDKMRTTYIQTGSPPDKKRVAELNKAHFDWMLKFYHEKGDRSWDFFYADQIRAWGTA